MQAGNDEPAITGINVTPLVDILLVVLIIFMATAPMISRRALKVDVPRAARHERAATEARQILCNAQGEIFLSGKKMTFSQLALELSRLSGAHADLQITLSGDKTLAYGQIVELLDVIRGAGVRKIGLEVQNK